MSVEVRFGATVWPVLRGAVRTHVVPDGSWLGGGRRATLRSEATPTGLRLVGEVDLATRQVLVDALRPTLTGVGHLRLDLTDLTFIDVGGAAVLVATANGLGAGRRLILRQPAPLLRRMLTMLWGPPPTLEMDDRS